MNGQPVLLELRRNFAIITLNRPDAGNSINVQLATQMLAEARKVADDPSVRAVLLAAAGREFCVGGDIREFASGEPASVIADITAPLHAALKCLVEMPKPLVVAVNGPSAGAGLGLAMLGDVVLAARSSHFTSAYTAIGMSPDAGTSWLLPRVAGLRVAQDMMLSNRRYSAHEAARVGIVSQVVDDEALRTRSLEMTQSLADGATLALGKTRCLLRSGAACSFEEHLEHETAAICASAGTSDGKEGIKSFLEKRRPAFKGG